MIKGLNPYLKMKDGSPWLGMVPEHWDVVPLRVIARLKSITRKDDRELLSVYLDRGVIKFSQAEEKRTNVTSEDLSKYQAVDPGDFVLNNQQAWRGSVGVSKFTGIVSPAYLVLSLNERIDPAYANLLFRERTMVDQYLISSRGVGTIQRNLYWPSLKTVLILLPPLEEQAAIVRFIDHIDRRIRRYIRAKQKLIKLLEEQKHAIIHHAVTSGIDRSVRLKPSGVEWLGSVPSHWELRKLRQCVTISGGMTPSMENRTYWNGSLPWVTPKDMKRVAIDDSILRVTEAAIKETSLKLISAPTILMVVRGMILARKVPFAWTTVPVTINQDMKALSPLPGVDARYLALLLDSSQPAFVPLIDEAGHGTRRLPTERWRDMTVPLPPKHEQEEIVRVIESETKSSTNTMNRAQSEILLLREYQTRLSADTVTGKIDVRAIAQHLPEERPDTESLEESDAYLFTDDEAADVVDDTLEPIEA
jgi:type I restriction enzyme S subunit